MLRLFQTLTDNDSGAENPVHMNLRTLQFIVLPSVIAGGIAALGSAAETTTARDGFSVFIDAITTMRYPTEQPGVPAVTNLMDYLAWPSKGETPKEFLELLARNEKAIQTHLRADLIERWIVPKRATGNVLIETGADL